MQTKSKRRMELPSTQSQRTFTSPMLGIMFPQDLSTVSIKTEN